AGKEDKPAKLPILPLRQVEFLDGKVGAAIVVGGGLVISSDGGATWKVPTEANRGDASHSSFLRKADGRVLARAYGAMMGTSFSAEAFVDLSQGRLGPLEQQKPKANEPPLITWIRETGVDPLVMAAEAGVEAPNGGAIIASYGMLARVDTSTGAITA